MPVTVPTLDDFDTLVDDLDALATRVTALENLPPGSTVSSGGGVVLDLYESGNKSELSTTLSDGGAWKNIYSVLVPDIRAGDILQVMAEAEFTNRSGHNCGVWSWLILATDRLAKGGIELGEANGRNIPTATVHDTHVKVATYQATADLGDRWVNMLSRTEIFGSEGKSVTVEPDYGRLSVIRYRVSS